LHINQLILKDYRNYQDLDLNFSENLNVIYGMNGQGKTNILEAIFVAGFGSSFRTKRDKELINSASTETYIRAELSKSYGDYTIEYTLKKDLKKEIKVNKNHLKKRSELFGHLNVVVFSPEDLKLIKEGPSERRRFIDREISNLKKKYCADLIEYHRILSQRNALIKKSRHKQSNLDMISIWDEQLASVGTSLMLERKAFIEKLNEVSYKLHLQITEEKEEIKLKYLPNIKVNSAEYDKIYMEFLNKLTQQLSNDVDKGYTTVGPHRDDLDIRVNGIDVKTYGSQGQQRTAALSLKLSEIEIIYDEIGEYPVLLLDDVMSELDKKRQNDLLKSLKSLQTIITITDTESIIDAYLEEANVIKIHNGQVI
jgi:DNA replication and repair protein RecF